MVEKGDHVAGKVGLQEIISHANWRLGAELLSWRPCGHVFASVRDELYPFAPICLQERGRTPTEKYAKK